MPIGIIVLVVVCIILKLVRCFWYDEDDEEPRPKSKPELPSSLYWNY